MQIIKMFYLNLNQLRLSTSLLCLSILCASVAAETPPNSSNAATSDIQHIVQKGDSLEKLANHYLEDTEQWEALQSYNQIKNPHVLRIGSKITIPSHLRPLTTAPAHAEFVQGMVTFTHPSNTNTAPAPLTSGTPLAEGMQLHVPNDGFLSIKLADGSIIRVQANSDIKLERMRHRGRIANIQTIIKVENGGIESKVQPSPHKSRLYEVKTPIGVASVRGTQFDVYIDNLGRVTTSVTKGRVGVDAHAPSAQKVKHAGKQTTLLAQGEGAAIAVDGRLGANQTLSPAPSLSSIPAVFTDPSILNMALPLPDGIIALQVQISEDAEFTHILRNGIFTSEQIEFLGVEDGNYILKVRAINADGIKGLSAQKSITVKANPVPPLYQSPEPNAQIAQGTGALKCTNVPEARWFHLQISRQANFNTLEVDAPHLTECSYRVDALPEDTYFWRIASVGLDKNGAPDPGPFAPAQAFEVVEIPDSPTAKIEQLGNVSKLMWHAQAGQIFRLQLASDSAFNQIMQDENLTEPHWTTPKLPAGVYYVRIQTQTQKGIVGSFSKPREITIFNILHDASNTPLQTSDGKPVQLQ